MIRRAILRFILWAYPTDYALESGYRLGLTLDILAELTRQTVRGILG